MRIFYLWVASVVFIFFTTSHSSAKSYLTEKKDADTLPIRQINGTTIHLVAIGDFLDAYMETTDGYTVVLNAVGLYEYAKANKYGDLVGNGTLANDPKNRKNKENRKLKRTTKHLRYSGEKLKKIQEKKTKLDNAKKIEKKNEK